MKKSLSVVYDYGKSDRWSGALIHEESAKVHSTIKSTIDSLTSVIRSDMSSPQDREWAKSRIDDLLRDF